MSHTLDYFVSRMQKLRTERLKATQVYTAKIEQLEIRISELKAVYLTDCRKYEDGTPVLRDGQMWWVAGCRVDDDGVIWYALGREDHLPGDVMITQVELENAIEQKGSV